MTKFGLAILFAIFSTNISFGQDCNCENNLVWVKKTFEENDAGFQYVIDQKGKETYSNHSTLFIEKARSVTNRSECYELLYKWLTFFRTGHVSIKPIGNTTGNTSTNTATNAAPAQKWETLQVNLPDFEKHLKNKKEADFEGIWTTTPYKIGIKKVGDEYLGFIIESGAETWKKGEIKLKISGKGGDIKATFYLRDKTPVTIKSIELLGNNYLQLDQFTLKRLAPAFPFDQQVESFFVSKAAQKPYIEELNKSTLLLRIPSFDGTQKRAIDSVISANKSKISSTENLIIDLRNNGGGSDASFNEIIPFLYTNPIRTVGVEFYSTKLNNQRMLDFINNPEYDMSEEVKKWAKESYDKLENQIGQFVNLDTTIVSIDKLDKVYPYPKNVGIIIHEGNGSTTEQFLLAAKQSKKVKLFGTTTAGVLDISNMYFVEAPCKDFELGYSLSRSMRIPEMTIDNKGIQPDYYIDKSIPQYKWVEFVSTILNGQ